MFRRMPARFLLAMLPPLLCALFLARALRIDPAEDAHIMFRYAENLAAGHGLVWNGGEKPVEGATEFLWTLLLAACALAGLDTGSAAQAVAFACVAGTILLMIRTLRFTGDVPLPVASGAALIFAAGPVIVQSLSGFGAPLFTFLMTLSWSALYAIARGRESARRRERVILPIALFLLCLTRPEGTLFALLILIGAFALPPREARRALFRNTLLLLCLPGLLYFLWRWNYYGWLLPNTFYAKQGGELAHRSGFEPILRFFRLLFPLFLAPLYLFFRSGERGRTRAIFLAAPPLLFPWFYLLIEQMQNIGYRFQFPVLPILLMISALSIRGIRNLPAVPVGSNTLPIVLSLSGAGLLFSIIPRAGGIPSAAVPALAAAAVAALLFLFFGAPAGAFRRRAAAARRLVLLALCILCAGEAYALARLTVDRTDSRYDHRALIGMALRPFASAGYRMVSTEAGWLPYFSRWKAVDPFGLYDEHVAHHGLDEEYLARLSPELIMFHVYRDSWAPDWAPNDPRWNLMTQTLYRYVSRHGYLLAARVGVHHDCCWYFVKRSCPDMERIRSAILSTRGISFTIPFDEAESVPPG